MSLVFSFGLHVQRKRTSPVGKEREREERCWRWVGEKNITGPLFLQQG